MRDEARGDGAPKPPEALGRWEPPPGSVVLRSAWRVDPDQAARGYAFALVLAVVVVGAWVLWRAPGVVTLPTPDPELAPLLRARQAYEAAPCVVLTVTFGLMGLGATKRCFGFDHGTLVGGLVVGAMQLAAWALPWGASRFSVQLGGSAAVGALAAAAVVSWPWGLPTRRRAVAATAYGHLWAFAWQAARADYLRGWWPGDLLVAQVGIAAGAALGASVVAIPWLLRSVASQSRSDGFSRFADAASRRSVDGPSQPR